MNRNRPEESCDVPLPLPVVPPRPVRPAEPCGPEVAPIVPPAYAPVPLVPAPVAFIPLGPLLVACGNVEVDCADLLGGADPNFYGDDVVILDADALKQEFFWTEVPGITEAQLNFIAGLPAETRDALGACVVADGAVVSFPLDAVDVSSVFSLLPSQARAVIDRVSALAVTAWNATRSLALSQLECRWYNEEQSATCGDGAVTEHEGTVYTPTVTIPAATFSSPISLEEANATALAAALAGLRCAYLNLEVTARCSEIPGLNNGQVADYAAQELAYPDPESLPVGGENPITRVLVYTVSAGTVLSLTSQEGADSIASILAQQGLECFFTAEGEAHCADEETVASPQSNALEGIRGKNVLVPRGMVQTLESQAVASALAAALAESFLDCFWLNREMTYACDDIDADPTNSEQRENHVTGVYPGAMVAANKSGQRVYVTALEATLAMLASPIKSPTYSVTVEAGEFSSPDGQAAVDTLAAVFASTQLSCVYCNPRINPVCVPTDGSGNLPVTLAFPVAANPTTMELPLDTARVDATWSIDATAGIPGIVYVEGEVEEDDWTPAAGFFAEDPESPVKTLLCSPDPFEAVAVADIAGMVPIAQLTPASREDTCQFTNDAHYAACRDADLPTPPPAGGVSVTIPAGGYNAYFSTRSLPGPNADLLVDSYVTIPAGAFTANSKATANQLAKVAALALLDCFFESPELKVYCGAGAGATLPSAETYTTLAGAPVTIPTTSPGFVASDPTHPVSEDSVGYYAPTPDATAPALAATPVIIPYGYSRSYISPQDAMDQAVLVGAGQLNCFFKAVVVAYCTPNADTRAVMTDGRYNGAPVLSEGLISTDPEDEIPGQVARFKYAGAVAFDPLTGERTNTPGIAVPSASGVAVSSITQADAHTNALADARSKLDCTHTNWTRNNFRCPDAKDILFQPHTVGVDVFDGVSTKDANIQAEALARSSTVCAPCSPFRLAVYGEYGVDPVWSFCGGAATFWGLSTWGTGVGAKLNSCKSGIEDNFTIKEVFWQTCGVPLPSTLPVATGTTLYWVKVACCEEVLPYPAGPSLLLISQASSYTEENVASPSFYPTEETATLNEDTAAEYIYVGAIVGGRSGADDGRAAVAYQHMNENLRFFGGGADSDPCYFGEIITVPADGVIPAAKAIRGGVIYGGGANKDVEHFTLDLETDAEMLVWLEVGITANTEDGVLMPHLETCDDPTWETGTIAGGYPDNTTPDKVTGDGVRIVPIGKLIIKEGAAAFERTGCGHITLGFCPPNNLPIVRV